LTGSNLQDGRVGAVFEVRLPVKNQILF